MNWYIEIVETNPIITAMIQFAILGTLGDIISKWIIKKKFFLPFGVKVLMLKMTEWALLSIFVKYAFVGFHGFIDSLVVHNLLPDMNTAGYAFSVSVSMNLLFGPFLVVMHRFLENTIAGAKNWERIDKALLSLVWFWIPAHTITFMLPKPFQIGIAALLSIVLGLILGAYNRKGE
ncbi:MAG: hypothetical protein K9L30_09770 [Desulfobacterales bacterium]|nr:hypothetical protein [Desulfobacterales bacterium]